MAKFLQKLEKCRGKLKMLSLCVPFEFEIHTYVYILEFLVTPIEINYVEGLIP